MHRVILYYQFQHIQNPEDFCREHRRVCQDLGLIGRVYIAQEGINGTLAGPVKAIEQYKSYLRSLNGFQDVEFKEDESDTLPFVKLIVKTRPEIVTLKSSTPVDVTHRRGKHLSPKEWRQAIESKEDMVMIDVRNNYESAIGHFKGALCPDVENFYDFPAWLDHAGIDKNKKVLMYCTGGIRCEKFSLMMEDQGYKDVYQLTGGIIKYAKEEGGAHYQGKCFVFDDRLAVPIEPNQKEPLSCCEVTGKPCDQYINCANMDCNRLFICSEEGAVKMQGCCSPACMQSKRRRPFNPRAVYRPSRKWYEYYEEKTEEGFSGFKKQQERAEVS